MALSKTHFLVLVQPRKTRPDMAVDWDVNNQTKLHNLLKGLAFVYQLV